MSTRSIMRHRAVIERITFLNTVDQYGHPIPSTPTIISSVQPCYQWSSAKRVAVANAAPGQGIIIMEDVRALFPKNDDVREQDIIVQFNDRQGTTIIDGVFVIDTLQTRPDHKLALLRKIS